ncbi:calcium/proton exchanger [Deinococcota bacterium DY0809b]
MSWRAYALVAVPLALAAEYLNWGGAWVFLLSAFALLPLAAWMGRATEELAARAGSTAGGLLNATFGNAAELIIAVIALNAGKVEVVKASISGSLLSNLLLVLGLSILLGGLRHHRQRFNAQAAGLLTTLLTLALVAFMLPAFFDLAERTFYGIRDPALPDAAYSLAVAGVLIAVYLANLWFSLVTHRDLVGGLEERHAPEWSPGLALAVLLASTAGVAVVSELLVSNIEAATQTLGLSEFFVGIIVIPLVGNAAEHLAAVSFAVRNKMDLAVQIAVGSSLQIALLVAPILVVWGWAVGRPFDLVFHNPLEIAGLVASIVITNAVVRDGETHWLEGVMLLGVYALLGFAFFYTPR